MNDSQLQIIDNAKQALRNLYGHYFNDGILAIYIWGSVTRSDFDPKTSDIDVICIVDNHFPKEENEKLREELTSTDPEREWGFQIIYLDELNGGAVRSRLAAAMSPQSILPSFPSWIWVSGNRYDRSDFSVKDASITERMKLNIAEIRSRLANIQTDTDYKKIRDRKGVVKACFQLIYNRQLLRNEYFDLDYNVLPDKADSFELPILKDLLNIKRSSLYEEESYAPYVKVISDFADAAEKELA
jgi:predicted nucleotidyltransferase